MTEREKLELETKKRFGTSLKSHSGALRRGEVRFRVLTLNSLVVATEEEEVKAMVSKL